VAHGTRRISQQTITPVKGYRQYQENVAARNGGSHLWHVINAANDNDRKYMLQNSIYSIIS